MISLLWKWFGKQEPEVPRKQQAMKVQMGETIYAVVKKAEKEAQEKPSDL